MWNYGRRKGNQMIEIRTKETHEFVAESIIKVNAIKQENKKFYLQIGNCWYQTDKESFEKLKGKGVIEI